MFVKCLHIRRNPHESAWSEYNYRTAGSTATPLQPRVGSTYITVTTLERRTEWSARLIRQRARTGPTHAAHGRSTAEQIQTAHSDDNDRTRRHPTADTNEENEKMEL